MSTTFTRQDFDVGTPTVNLVVSDLNGDGYLDLVTTNFLSSAPLSVLLGDGAGGFSTAIDLQVPIGVSTLGYLASANMNGDGKLDVVYTFFADLNVRVLLGDGAGGFQIETPAGIGWTASSIAVGDVNGDGRADVVTGSSAGRITVQIGNGLGGFSTSAVITSFSPNSPDYLNLADMNGDGRLDIVSASYSDGTVSVRLGNGDGSFSSANAYSAGGTVAALAIADVNGDGQLDVVTAGGGWNGMVSVLLGDGTSFTQGRPSVSAAFLSPLPWRI